MTFYTFKEDERTIRIQFECYRCKSDIFEKTYVEVKTMTERTVTIRGREEDVNTVLKLLRHMEYLGHAGASRNLLVRVDGDGSGRIRVTDENGDKLDNFHYNTKQNLDMGAVVGIYDIG